VSLRYFHFLLYMYWMLTRPQHCVIDHVYDLLLDLYDKYDDSNLKARVLLCLGIHFLDIPSARLIDSCLGFLFRAKPTLMTLESSAAVMDAIFASPDENDRGRLLKIFQDFLLSQVAKHNETIKGTQNNGKGKGKAVNMDELIGNTDGFADSG
jgi:cohesin loading factor subunit SCC2